MFVILKKKKKNRQRQKENEKDERTQTLMVSLVTYFIFIQVLCIFYVLKKMVTFACSVSVDEA